jgi:hypothetical protein
MAGITRQRLKELVKDVMVEETEYQQFFQKALDKAGKSIPSMSDEEKKAFFDKIDAAWTGKGEKNEELVGGQKELDVDGDGDIEGDDLADLRAGKKADESVITEDTKRANILGIDFNISEMNGRIFFSFIDKKAASLKIREIGTNKIVNLIQKSLDNAYGKGEFFFKGGDHAEFQNGYLFQRNLTNVKLNKLKFESIDSVNEASKPIPSFIPSVGIIDDYKLKSLLQRNPKVKAILGDRELKFLNQDNTDVIMVSGKPYNSITTDGKLEFELDLKKNILVKPLQTARPKIKAHYSQNESIKEGKLTEGRYDKDLDKIEAAVKNASSFMGVGAELKKAGIKYDFTTSMIPMYMIKVSGNTIAIVNKKYASGAERNVKDIAIGLLEGVVRKSVNEAESNDIVEFLKQNYKKLRDDIDAYFDVDENFKPKHIVKANNNNNVAVLKGKHENSFSFSFNENDIKRNYKSGDDKLKLKINGRTVYGLVKDSGFTLRFAEGKLTEGKKVFKVNPGIGKAKYSISSHDGKKTHKDGSDFYDIEIFKNKVDLENGIKKYTSNGFVKESVNEAFNHIITVETPTQVISKPVAAQIMALAKKGVRSKEIGLKMQFVGNNKLAADAFQKVKNKIYFSLDKRNESINTSKN